VSETAAAELAYLSRALKAPRLRAVSGRLAERARDEGWDYEAYLAAVLAEEVSARDNHGGSARVKAARFPAVKTLDDFDFTVQTSVSRQVIAHLAQLDFLAETQNVVFLGPPGTGKTHLSIALGVAAARRGHRVAFATAHQWVNRLGSAKRAGHLDEELEHLGRIPLLIVDEVGCAPRGANHQVGSVAHPRPPQWPGEAGGSLRPKVRQRAGAAPTTQGRSARAGRARKQGRQVQGNRTSA
jgi:DNA replication protein DnaC